MRSTLAILLVLTLISTVSAVDKDSWVFPGEPLEYQGNTYYAFLDTTRTSAFIESSENSFMLRLDTCQRIGFTRYCFVEVANDSNTKWFTFDSNRRPVYGMRFTFESFGPNVRATQKYTSTNPDVNSRIDGEVSVRNTGNEDAYDVLVTYTIDSNARMRTCSDCDMGERSFTKRFTRLRPGETRTVTFSMTVEEPTPFATEASVTFSDGSETGSVSPLRQSFSIKKPYETGLSKPGTATVGDWVQARLTVRNTGENPITVDAIPVRDSAITYEEVGYDPVSEYLGLELGPGERLIHDYRARSTRAGTFTSGYDVTITREGDTFNESLRTPMTWRLQDVRLTSRLSKTRPVSGDTNDLYIAIENTGGITFTNLDVSYSGEANGSKSIPSLRPGQRESVFQSAFTHGERENTTTESFVVTLRYDTQFGEEQTTTQTVPYTLISLDESYRIRRVVQPTNPGIGEEFTVTVYGKRMTESGVLFSEVSDQLIGARVERGVTRNAPRIDSDEIRIYQYEAIREDERFAIITSTEVRFGQETARIKEVFSTFDMSEEEIDQVLDEDNGKPDDDAAQDAPEEPDDAPAEGDDEENGSEEDPVIETPQEERGFFARIIAWFGSLFG